MRYFQKELPAQPFWFSDGTHAPYTVRAERLALIAVEDDDKHIQELDAAAAKGIAGLTRLTGEQFEAKKKVLESLPPEPPSQQRPTYRIVHAEKPAELTAKSSAPRAEVVVEPAAAVPATDAKGPAELTVKAYKPRTGPRKKTA